MAVPRGPSRTSRERTRIPHDLRTPLASPVAMDLSLFFAVTAGSSTPNAACPRCCCAPGASGSCSTAARGPSPASCARVGLPDVDAIFISHLHLDHWLGLPGMIKTFEMRDHDRRLDVFGPPGLSALFGQVLGRSSATRSYRSTWSSLSHHGSALGRPWSPPCRSTTVSRPTATRYRGRPPGPVRRRGRARARRHRGAGLRAPAARRDRQRRPPEQVVGADRAGPPDRLHRRHRARAVASRSTRTAPTCWSTRRPSARTARPRARPAARLRRQAARVAREAGVKLLALTHLSTRYFPREIRERPRRSSRTRRPARLRRDEVPFPSAASPHLVKAELMEAAPSTASRSPSSSPPPARTRPGTSSPSRPAAGSR